MIVKDLIQKFPQQDLPRPQQKETLNKLTNFLNSNKKFAVCNLPTGSGKSHIAMTCANATNDIDLERKDLIESYEIFRQSNSSSPSACEVSFEEKKTYGAFILTVTKNLQDQYKNLFSDSILLKGKNNYQCNVDLNSTVDGAPCIFAPELKKKCFSQNKCSFYNDRKLGLQNKNTITNYKAYLSLPNFLKRRELLICDEASNLEEELISFYSLTVSYSALQVEEIVFKKILTDDTVEAYRWLNDINIQIENKILDLKQKFDLLKSKKNNNFDALVQKYGTRYSKLSQLLKSLNNVITHWHTCQYIIESKTSQEITFVPLNIKPLTDQIFNNHDKVIFMSATISNHHVFTKTLGISAEDYFYIESPSSFNPEKSPIYCSSKYSLSYQNLEKFLPHVLDMVIEICKNHKGEKGLIHTHTHNITQALKKKIKNDQRFLFREHGFSNEEIIETHKSLKDLDSIIVSPSMDSGVSLDDDLGRFQIIIKAPFLPLGSKRIKKIFDKNPEYYISKMLDTLIQMCGRCTRSEKDHSITYILDGSATKAIKKYKNTLPSHFLNRFK